MSVHIQSEKVFFWGLQGRPYRVDLEAEFERRLDKREATKEVALEVLSQIAWRASLKSVLTHPLFVVSVAASSAVLAPFIPMTSVALKVAHWVAAVFATGLLFVSIPLCVPPSFLDVLDQPYPLTGGLPQDRDRSALGRLSSAYGEMARQARKEIQKLEDQQLKWEQLLEGLRLKQSLSS